MHMADALLSPVVSGVMTAASATAVVISVKKVTKEHPDEKLVPMMGVMGAFIFAAQMINFTIPGTGSSGHIGGGILLAALLGAYPALLTLASVLFIQCLFFADGGLLALGCNIFNMGVLTCLFAYSFIFKPLLQKRIDKKRISIASIVSVVVGLQLGAFSVVLETLVSGVTELPFGAFAALMQPIHLAIGLIEGIITAAVLCFVYQVRPEILLRPELMRRSKLLDHSNENGKTVGNGELVGNREPVSGTEVETEMGTKTTEIESREKNRMSFKKVLGIFMVAAILVGGGLSLLASGFPDGLEWSVEKVAGSPELEREGGAYETAENVVKKTAFMPDYGFMGEENDNSAGTATAGVIGSVITVIFAGGIGLVIHLAKKKNAAIRNPIV